MKIILVLALALAGCTASAGYVQVMPTAQDAEVQRRALMTVLKDPSSAQIEEVRVYQNPEGGRMICGKVNGRNSFGGYAGFEVFTIQTIPGVDYSKSFARPVYGTGLIAELDCGGAGYPS